MNALMDFVEIKHAYRTDKAAVSFWKWACHLKYYDQQAAIFENGFVALTNECVD